LNPTQAQFIADDCRRILAGDRAEALAPLKNSTLAITGGTGFFGSWILELVAQLNETRNFGTHVVAYARDIDKFKKEKPHLAAKPFLQLSKTDIRYECDFPRTTKWVIHAAANRDRRFHASCPLETMSVIAQGTETMLRSLEPCADLQMTANLSSGLVYGQQPLDMPRIPVGFSGVLSINHLQSGYAEAKRYAELLCSSYRAQNRMPVLSIRPFSFVGPYQSMESPWAVTSFLQDAIHRRPIRVLGDGTTVRSYLYPSDAAYWILRMLTRGESGQSFNLGSPEAITLETLAQAVASHFSPRPEVHFSVDPSKSGPASRLIPDVSQEVEKLGLEVTLPFEAALKRTVEWFKLVGRE